MIDSKYSDIVVDVKDGIGTIKFNRPQHLNSFGGNLISDVIDALITLDKHPDTTFTVITGEGRFFAAGADVSGVAERASGEFKHDGDKRVHWAQKLSIGTELVRCLIEHRKVLVLAMNGPGVGAGAAWFQGASDLFYAASGTWLQVTFNQLGLVPECGSIVNWSQSIGHHRANEWLMFGGRATVEELQTMGLVNQIFLKEGFHEKVHNYLKEMLVERSGASMMETKRLQARSVRDQRVLALYDSYVALMERFVDGEPTVRMTAKMNELKDKRNARSSKM